MSKSKKKPTLKDVKEHCDKNGYYLGNDLWIPYIKNKDEYEKVQRV